MAISWVKEVHHTIQPVYTPEEEDLLLNGDGPSKYYTYIVCKNNMSGRKNKFDVYKIDPVDETIKAIGREINYSDCLRVIKQEEPNGTTVISQKPTSREHRA